MPKTVAGEMHAFKHGELHSGSKHGPVVTDRKQAIAIALHEAGQSHGASVQHEIAKRHAAHHDPHHSTG